MSAVGRTMAGVAGRLLARPRADADGYALCPVDGFRFRPAYTDGICPLCGEVAPGGAPPLPLLVRIDRFWLGMATLTLVSFGMLALVLAMFFRT